MYCEQSGVLGGSLLSDELWLLGPQVVKTRREEFAAGRTCARIALAKLALHRLPFLEAHEESRCGQSMSTAALHTVTVIAPPS